MILSLAPMLKVTTAQYRLLLRIISKDVVLFTEMISADFILRNEQFWSRIGKFDKNTVIQLGGCNPVTISKSVKKIIESSEFRLFNLNVGCPSNKVTKGQFGASLMLRVNTINDIINTVYEETGVVLSVKCRIGVDEHDSFEFFENFIRSVSKNTKCRIFYVHARKCWLQGLSPKENRNIPKLNYSFVQRIKEKYPDLEIHLNGSVKSVKDAAGLNGIMIGREAMKNLFVFENLLSTGTVFDVKTHEEETTKDESIKEMRTIEEDLNLSGKTITLNKDDQFVEKLKDLTIKNDASVVKENICNYNTPQVSLEQNPIKLRFFILKEYFKQLDTQHVTHSDIIPLMNLFRDQKCSKIIKQLLNTAACKKNMNVDDCVESIRLFLTNKGYFD